MTEELTPEQKLELAGAIPTEKGKVLFDACHLAVKDGHIVAECDSIETSQELALLLAEDVFIRIKPSKAEIEELKKPEPDIALK
ncbi:unnamed protein product [marine sediment metagenome]|uniref:Uncharacterized protein n=1 Tax=marine sediment metagenome TaxID=412755 RepID=X1KTD6_9ZZZZ